MWSRQVKLPVSVRVTEVKRFYSSGPKVGCDQLQKSEVGLVSVLIVKQHADETGCFGKAPLLF